MNTILKKITAFWRIASAIVVMWQPVSLSAQMSPFPAGYISYYDTISYDYGNLNYLIITADSLRPAFRDFAMSKALKGYEVKIAAVEDIYQTYSNIVDSVERIKWYIANEYIYYNKHLQFVLLGGDVNIVPTRYAAPRKTNSFNTMDYEFYQYYIENSLKYIASDLYFVSFYDSFGWDDGNNGKYAETQEHISMIPPPNIDIADDHAVARQYINISRLPVHTSDDVCNYTTKLFRYERGNLKYSSAYNRALFAGCKAFCDKDGMSDTKYWNDSIINHFLTGRSVTTLYDASFTKANLQSYFANTIGYNLINIDTHGIETGWRMQDSISWYGVDAAILQSGNAASLVTTPACDVADFSSIGCLGEAMILNANNNTIAFWGATNLGLGPLDGEFDISAGLSRELIGHFYRHLSIEPNKRLGNIIFKSKRDFNFPDTIYSFERFLVLTQTLLGDAEFSVYDNAPNHIQPLDIIISDDNFVIESFDSLAHYNVMLNGCDVSRLTHNADYSHLFPLKNLFHPGLNYDESFEIGVTKDGYAPWRSDKDYYNIVRIQNQTLKKEHLRSSTFLLGKNVDASNDSGANDVAVGGDVIFEVGNNFTITDSFTCPLGATMTIIPLKLTTY